MTRALAPEMGRRDVSVTLLEQEVPPLTALFYELTEGRTVEVVP